jgi:hypothetical protein
MTAPYWSLAKPMQLTFYVNDEKSAIQWLKQQLDPALRGEPKTQGELTNDFNRVMNRAKHEQPLELIEILKQNFLQNKDGKWYVPDHNKAADLEKIRQRALLREFKDNTEGSGRCASFAVKRCGPGSPTVSSVRIMIQSSRSPSVCRKRCCEKIQTSLMYYDSAMHKIWVRS